MDSGKVQVYCHMAEIPGCDGGGWTLVMKINGSKVLRCIVWCSFGFKFIVCFSVRVTSFGRVCYGGVCIGTEPDIDRCLSL